MTQIRFQQTSPSGTATLDSDHVVVDFHGRAWVCSGPPGTPLTHEQAKALHAHFGANWTDAVDGMTGLDEWSDALDKMERSHD